MYSVGLDIGTSFIKAALTKNSSGKLIDLVLEPSKEQAIISFKDGWAEQDPEVWWNNSCKAIKSLISKNNLNPNDITSLGISYQMHGLVLVDKKGKCLRKSIIWCDDRAVEIGKSAYVTLGKKYCTENLLNSPANFTASKLKWVKQNEPSIYKKIFKYMLPGDYIAYKMSNKVFTTINGLSEGILWDYNKNEIANWLLDYYEIENSLTPDLIENFTNQGEITTKASTQIGLPKGIPITYRAGDQPNNALSLNVMRDGEVAATGGTSGVVYAVTDKLISNESIRINHFAHVNYSKKSKLLGKLLCINGSGILYKWLKDNFSDVSYEQMNKKASQIKIGSEGLIIIPFGNGAERMFDNKNIGSHFCNLNFNHHNKSHVYRASLEAIAFSFVYGIEIMKND